MELDQVMRTAFAAREFTDDPVPDVVLYRILDRARFAPSGGNRQGWRVVVVGDRGVRRQLAELVKPTMQLYVAQVQAGENPFNTVHASTVDPAAAAHVRVPDELVQYIATVPVLLVVAVDLSVVASFDRDLPRVGVISGASIYPFVWNILLAARDEGFGGALRSGALGRRSLPCRPIGRACSGASSAARLGRPSKVEPRAGGPTPRLRARPTPRSRR